MRHIRCHFVLVFRIISLASHLFVGYMLKADINTVECPGFVLLVKHFNISPAISQHGLSV